MLLIPLITIFFCTASAYNAREGNISAEAGPFFYKTDFKGASTQANSPYLSGLGFLVNGDINDSSALEVAMFHMNKRFLRRAGQRYLSEQTQVIHITMGYKRWFTRTISASLGFYSAYPLGKTRVLYSDFSPSDDMITSARDTTEYGIDLALNADIWSGKNYDVVANVRYSLSATSRTHEKSDHFGTFIGLRFLVQEKKSRENTEKNKIK